MTAYFPILIALLFVAFAFAIAFNKGVIGLLASGTALAAATVTLIALFDFLPGLAKTYLDINLGWRFTLASSATLAFVVFLAGRIVLGIVFKRLFNPDSPLHRFVDGTAGGILSLFPALVGVFLYFTCVRAAGTVQELNYVHSLTQEGIELMGGKIPPPPITISWRNAIERLPFVATGLDKTDFFSRRSHRNAAALVLISGSTELKHHLLTRPETSRMLESVRLVEVAADPAVVEAKTKLDRVALVTAPAIRAMAADPEAKILLERLELLPLLEQFVASLVPPTDQPAKPVTTVQP